MRSGLSQVTNIAASSQSLFGLLLVPSKVNCRFIIGSAAQQIRWFG
jgi:hypothetical protein